MRLIPGFVFLLMAFAAYAIAFSVHAQEPHQPQQRQMPETVQLSVVIHTGKERPDVQHQELMAKGMTRQEQIDTCTTMANEFLSHRYPDSVGAVVLSAQCVVPLNIADSDT